MGSGTCPGSICGTATIVGDTTSSLTYTINLASGVSFHADHTGNSGTGPFLFFELTDPGVTIAFSDLSPGGTIGGKTYSYNAPTSGSFAPNPGNFPGPYNFEATCTNNTSGKICGSSFTFKVSGATTLDPFVIGAPAGHGLFLGDDIGIVADLSVNGACGSPCAIGTGDVGTSLASAVPEPSTWAMMILGFAGIGFMAYRRKSNGSALAAA